MPDSPPDRSRWFWINLGALCLLAPLSTYWFQQHLQLYFTEIVVVGGAFTLWALVRMVWGLIAKATQLDAWETSRNLLASPAVTRGLVAATLLFAILWWSTGSIYLQLAGSGAGEYQVEVVRKSDGSPLIARDSLTASRPVVGLPMMLRSETLPLECRIVQPVEFEPLDCNLAPGKATRIEVPRSFKPKEYHLLRIVPGAALYRNLPQDSDQPVTRYELLVERGSDALRAPDLRRQTVFAGASPAEMSLVMRLHDAPNYERFLDARLRAAKQDRDNASLMAAILSTSTRTLPGMYVKAGDVLKFTVTYTRSDEGEIESGTLEGFPMTYQVTSDQVQTLWLPQI